MGHITFLVCYRSFEECYDQFFTEGWFIEKHYQLTDVVSDDIIKNKLVVNS